MAIISITDCPIGVKKLWRIAEICGFSDFIYMADGDVLMGSLPNSTIDDDRVPISLDMYEIRHALGLDPAIDRRELQVIVEQLRWCEYENEAGYMINNVAFQRLVGLSEPSRV